MFEEKRRASGASKQRLKGNRVSGKTMELLNFGWQQKLVLVTVPVSVAKQTNSLPVSWTTVQQASRQTDKQADKRIDCLSESKQSDRSFCLPTLFFWLWAAMKVGVQLFRAKVAKLLPIKQKKIADWIEECKKAFPRHVTSD